MSITDNRDINKLIKIVLIIWILCSIYLIIIKWNAVSDFAFNDTDDFMRYHQYSEWIKNGNWYLQPDPKFNPTDGVIIHWSRIADIPLAGIALLASIFTDWPTAFTFSNVVTPLVYLLIFLLVISLLSYRLFGLETAQIAMLFALLSPQSGRLIPGALDHHNLQFILLSLFSLYIVLEKNVNLEKKSIFIALCISISLWIGLENIYSFFIVLAIFILYGLLCDLYYFKLSQKVLLYSSIFSVLAQLLNRPINEFFYPHYDVLSFPFTLTFIVGFFTCYTLNRILAFTQHNKIKKAAILVILSIIFLLPVVILYPDLLKGGYANYPSILKENWLAFVSEARPLIKTIPKDKSDIAYIIMLIPALISPLFFKGKEKIVYFTIYAIFIINFTLAIVWQVRMLSTCTIIAIPLQAYVCLELRNRCSYSITKAIILLLFAPTILLFLVKICFNFNDESNNNKVYDTKYDNSFYAAIKLLNKNKIENQIILPTIDLGAAIIALTTNSSISAPYHRNIRGNTDTMMFHLSTDDNKAKDILIKNKINYLILDKDTTAVLNQAHEGRNIMLNRLFTKEKIPSYLEFVDQNEQSTILLYKVKLENKESPHN